MGALVQHCEMRPERFAKGNRSRSALRLIKGSISSQKLSRQFPVLVGLHRAIDGALIAVLVVAASMSGLALHWQHLWTLAFNRLESTRDLSQRLVESTALLERHLLKRNSLPELMVPTKAANLIYLNNPYSMSQSRGNAYKPFAVLIRLKHNSVNHGY